MSKKKTIQIQLNFDRIIYTVVIFCLASEVVIVVLDILMNLAEFWYLEKFKKLSNVALEKSFGTWFSVVQNFIVAITALIISLHHKYISDHKGRFAGWILIAIFFAYISLDDHLVLHERISGTFGPMIFNSLFSRPVTMPTYEWLFLLGPFFGAFGVFLFVFLYRQLKQKKYRLTLITGLLLWVAAVILDAWDGTSDPYDWFLKITGFKGIYIMHFFMLIEEMLEMLGSTLFLYLFLSHIKTQNLQSSIDKCGRN